MKSNFPSRTTTGGSFFFGRAVLISADTPFLFTRKGPQAPHCLSARSLKRFRDEKNYPCTQCIVIIAINGRCYIHHNVVSHTNFSDVLLPLIQLPIINIPCFTFCQCPGIEAPFVRIIGLVYLHTCFPLEGNNALIHRYVTIWVKSFLSQWY